ncbi:DNA adenine methylase [Thermodesulfobacteriota bacterium]
MNYPGGKGGVFQRLINLMPPHEVYIESYLGGGAVMRNKRPAGRNIGIEIDPKVIKMWEDINQTGFDLIHSDAITFLTSYPFTGKELVYCDPPYLRETRKKYYPLYKYEYTQKQHMELLEVIKSLPCLVMISGYKSTLYSRSLENWRTYSFQAACHHGVATEYIWMNYPAPVELHDYHYLGDTFRDRERIKLKSERWVKRLRAMPVLERQALLAAIDNLNRTKAEKIVFMNVYES